MLRAVAILALLFGVKYVAGHGERRAEGGVSLSFELDPSVGMVLDPLIDGSVRYALTVTGLPHAGEWHGTIPAGAVVQAEAGTALVQIFAPEPQELLASVFMEGQ